MRGYLFVCGCPRSGTTAFTDLLAADERMVVGMERFKFVIGDLRPEFFAEDVFFSPQPNETNIRLQTDFYPVLRERWKHGGVVWIGDKVGRYVFQLPLLATRFPEARFVALQRDIAGVASSFNARAANPNGRWPAEADYRRAVDRWTRAVERLRDFESDQGGRLFLLPYEEFFAGRAVWLDAVYRFLELEPTPEVRAEYARRTANWEQFRSKPLSLDEAELAYVEEHRRPDLEAWIGSRLEHQLERYSARAHAADGS